MELSRCPGQPRPLPTSAPACDTQDNHGGIPSTRPWTGLATGGWPEGGRDLNDGARCGQGTGGIGPLHPWRGNRPAKRVSLAARGRGSSRVPPGAWFGGQLGAVGIRRLPHFHPPWTLVAGPPHRASTQLTSSGRKRVATENYRTGYRSWTSGSG
jgi:hypothetical protein